MGGLGNQMFQYAAARRLSFLNNVPLKLDLSWFDIENSDKLTSRKYGLDPFNIIEEFPSPAEVSKFPLRLKKLTTYFKGPFRTQFFYIREKYYHFDPEVLHLGKKVYLDGYWQSEKYFDDIREIIRNEFTFKHDPEGLNQEYVVELQNTDEDTVSLHFRRGDYITNSTINRFHGHCPLDYYHAAIQRMVPNLRKPHFMIFSDDPEWVVENFKIDYPSTIISHNGPAYAYEDLRLMSLCKHHIIANSTFSWWGAWLSQNPAKLVIAPRKWFNEAKNNSKDLIPEQWIII